MARRPTGPQCARGPRSEAIPGKCGCCKGCRSTKIFRATLLYWSWSWGIRSILQYCSYYEQLGFGAEEKGGQLLSQVPPCSTGQGVCRNVVLQRTPKLGGQNRALKPPNDPVGTNSIKRYVLDLFIALLISSRGGMFSLSISTSWSMSETGFGVFSYS